MIRTRIASFTSHQTHNAYTRQYRKSHRNNANCEWNKRLAILVAGKKGKESSEQHFYWRYIVMVRGRVKRALECWSV